jgi:hypothetical protein
MNAHRGQLGVTEWVLLETLGLPEDTSILEAQWDASTSVLNLVITHPDLPRVEETERAPRVKPVQIAAQDGSPIFVTWETVGD